MKPNIVPYILLFVVGLGIALVASNKDQLQERFDEKIWLKLAEDDIQSIHYQDSKLRADVEKVGNDQFWIKTFDKPESGDWQLKDEFKSNKKFTKIITNFAPLQAMKVIGKAAELKLEDYGLQQPEGKLRIHLANIDHEFEIGKRSFQSPYVFVRDLQQDMVILIKQEPLKDLGAAKRELFENKLVMENLESVRQILVKGENTELRLDRVEQGANKDPKWISSDLKDKEDSTSTWISKILKLTVASYSSRDDLQNFANELDQIMNIELLDSDQKPIDTLKFLRQKQVNEQGKRDYWAWSPNSIAYMKLNGSRIETLLDDLKSFQGQ